MSSFFEKLAESNTGQSSSEHLKLLGKRAAGMYISKEAGSLTDAVHRIAQDEDLSRDQISRISEMANQETWKSLFVEQDSRHTQFEPASAEAVIGELAVKPDVAETERLEDLDYSLDVPNQNLQDDIDLGDLFGIKRDAPEYAALNPARQEQTQSEKTASVADSARYTVDNAASLLADAGETFYQLVKHAHLTDEVGILQISKAVAVVLNDQDFAKDVMQKIASRLESEGVKFNHREELQKIAHPLVVNHEHPLVQAAVNFERAAFSYYSASAEHEKLAAAHRKASNSLRDKLRRR